MTTVEHGLRAHLERDGARLSQRVMEEIYADPFWAARFGDRGRHHADRDGGYHLEYLVEALAANDPLVFTTYAVWLRQVLVSRGMCSHHLADHFERLATAIDGEPWPGRARAIEILRAGAAALGHVVGDAQLIDAARALVVARAAAGLAGDGGPWIVDDLALYLSYLTDALVARDPAGFLAHVQFMATMDPQRAAPRTLRALDRALAHELPALGPEPATYLAAGADALTKRGLR